MKLSKVILIVTAFALITFSSLLDITDFGRDWRGFNEVDPAKIILAITVIIGSGFFLAAFFWRRQKYRSRLPFTISLAAIGFSVFIFSNLIINEYGLSDPYNGYVAKRDIRKGKIQVLSAGLTVYNENQKAIELIHKRFGYTVKSVGCIYNRGISRYNDVMEHYLDKINGPDWRIRERHLIDSLKKQ